MRTGYAHLPLHGGKAPRWLFSRMVKLAREMTCLIVSEHGADELLVRLSDPSSALSSRYLSRSDSTSSKFAVVLPDSQ